MPNTVPVIALICFSIVLGGCSRSDNAELAKAKAEAEAAREGLAAARDELAKGRADANAARAEANAAKAGVAQGTGSDPTKQTVAKQPELKTQFDDKDMVRPINQFRGYSIGDYRKLPNCLDVFSECLAVSFDGRTSEQYKSEVTRIAQRPCRMVLKMVDVSADYDYAEFELLKDDGESGLDVLKQAGDLGNYTRHLRSQFSISNIKAKGLDSKNRSIGDRVILVGIGDVVAASPWGASRPSYGMPKGDERYVMLRAFGKPVKHNSDDYEFAFMVRNWYIAAQ